MAHPSPLASQIKSKTIGDCVYQVEPLGFLDGRKAFVRLGNLLGPALSALDKREGATEADAANAFYGAIGLLLATIKDEDLAYFEGLFSKRTTVTLPDGREPVLKDIIAEHFIGARFGDYFAWLAFALWGTYGDFFTVGLGKLGGLTSNLGKVKASE